MKLVMVMGSSSKHLRRKQQQQRAKVVALKPVSTATLLILALILFTLLGILQKSYGSDFFVTSVLRELPMKNGEGVQRDVYINAGQNNGLKVGLFLDALRRMAVHDNINSKVIGNTSVRIARLRVIHSDGTFSIARLVKMYEKDQTPLGGFDNVMIGDLIEVSPKQ